MHAKIEAAHIEHVHDNNGSRQTRHIAAKCAAAAKVLLSATCSHVMCHQHSTTTQMERWLPQLVDAQTTRCM
jgi:hypothetical protein